MIVLTSSVNTLLKYTVLLRNSLIGCIPLVEVLHTCGSHYNNPHNHCMLSLPPGSRVCSARERERGERKGLREDRERERGSK